MFFRYNSFHPRWKNIEYFLYTFLYYALHWIKGWNHFYEETFYQEIDEVVYKCKGGENIPIISIEIRLQVRYTYIVYVFKSDKFL